MNYLKYIFLAFFLLASCGEGLVNESTINFKPDVKTSESKGAEALAEKPVKEELKVEEKKEVTVEEQESEEEVTAISLKTSEDLYLTEKNKPIEIKVSDLIKNDEGAPGVNFEFSQFGVLNKGGTLVKVSDDVYKYMPAAGFEGVEEIKYEILGPEGAKGEGLVKVDNLAVLEDFNRGADQLGALWPINKGNGSQARIDSSRAGIVNDQLKFESNNSPIGAFTIRSIGAKTTGKIIWEFDFLFDTDNNPEEPIYGFVMQLGNKAKFDTTFDGVKNYVNDPNNPLDRSAYQDGAVVDLLWGTGARFFGSDAINMFGYGEAGDVRKVIGNASVVSTNGVPVKVKVEVDLDNKKYSVKVGNEAVNNIPYFDDVTIDSMRFMSVYTETQTDNKKYIIDNVKLKHIP